MNVFFELAESFVGKTVGLPGRYVAAYSVRSMVPIPSRYLNLMRWSERVWTEDETGVRYIKNRFDSASVAVVDMKEFFLVKLRSARA